MSDLKFKAVDNSFPVEIVIVLVFLSLILAVVWFLKQQQLTSKTDSKMKITHLGKTRRLVEINHDGKKYLLYESDTSVINLDKSDVVKDKNDKT
ncbi:hypothetical protein HR060_10945 [Catenovulum sp. SM1970]|uniref:hypothetical protein n=1 Tax=Marinifaba aquimaris TaxID=2741323 RepID=UPI001572E3DE|nr:hypothetical protein [Marinifaba aquimaris]NTS77376.1 hypothetical protein [Marinifaba aquimaris]